MNIEPKIYNGSVRSDSRGTAEFFNDLDLSEYKRFYKIQNFQKNQIRAWHGHKLESKLAYVLEGFVHFSLVKLENWENPSQKLSPVNFFLNASQHSMLYITAGYANGFKSITDSTSILFFSNKNLNESLNDDYRFPHDYWNPWERAHY